MPDQVDEDNAVQPSVRMVADGDERRLQTFEDIESGDFVTGAGLRQDIAGEIRSMDTSGRTPFVVVAEPVQVQQALETPSGYLSEAGRKKRRDALHLALVEEGHVTLLC